MELLFAGLACAASLGIGWIGGRSYEKSLVVCAVARAQMVMDIMAERNEEQQAELERLRETVGKLVDQRHPVEGER